MAPSRYQGDEKGRRKDSAYVAFAAAPVTPAKLGTSPRNTESKRGVGRDSRSYRGTFGSNAQGSALDNPSHPFLPNDWASEDSGRDAVTDAALGAAQLPYTDMMERMMMERFGLVKNADAAFFNFVTSQSMAPHFQQATTVVSEGAGAEAQVGTQGVHHHQGGADRA